MLTLIDETKEKKRKVEIKQSSSCFFFQEGVSRVNVYLVSTERADQSCFSYCLFPQGLFFTTEIMSHAFLLINFSTSR